MKADFNGYKPTFSSLLKKSLSMIYDRNKSKISTISDDRQGLGLDGDKSQAGISKPMFHHNSDEEKSDDHYDDIMGKVNCQADIIKILRHSGNDTLLINGKPYLWFSLITTPVNYDLDKIESNLLIRQSIFRASEKSTTGDKLYKLAIIADRTSYEKGSEQITWIYSSDVANNHNFTDNGRRVRTDTMTAIKLANVEETYVKYISLCFPELIEGNYDELYDEHDTYTFVCVNLCGWNDYVYCLRRSVDNRKLPTVFCIVSSRIAYKFYSSLLHEAAVRYQIDHENAFEFLKAMGNKHVPKSGHPTTYSLLNLKMSWYCWTPYQDRCIENLAYLCLHQSVKVPIEIFNALLCSYSVLCFSRHISKLSRCVHAISTLLYPFFWPYQLVTIMPISWAIDYLDVPSPFIFGFLSSLMAVVKSRSLKNILLVDLDTDTVVFYNSTGKTTIKNGTSFYDHNNYKEVVAGDFGRLKIEKHVNGLILPPVLVNRMNVCLSYVKRFKLIPYKEHIASFLFAEVFLDFFVSLLNQLPDVLAELTKDLQLSKVGVDSNKSSIMFSADLVREMIIDKSGKSSCWPKYLEYKQFLSYFTETMIFSSFIESEQWKGKRAEKFYNRIIERSKLSEKYLSCKTHNIDPEDYLYENFKEFCGKLDSISKVINFNLA
ncbi:hypothetical protein GJ496_002911 [Pomphorhynchus laevis]|nr:hypothetical protein GJ496_002911 [Pomphorhynchus laevis]